MLFSARGLSANSDSNRALPPRPRPPPNRPRGPRHPCTVAWGLVVVPSTLTASTPLSTCSACPTCPSHWAGGDRSGFGSPALPLPSQGPPGSSWPHKDTLPSPPGEAVSPLARLLFCFKGFPSVEVNTVSITGAIYKALRTHKVFVPPPPSPQQTGRAQAVLRVGPWDQAATVTARKGRGRPQELLGPSASSSFQFRVRPSNLLN